VELALLVSQKKGMMFGLNVLSWRC